MAKKFGQVLTPAQFALARRVEAAGLASISRIVKAFERSEASRINEWKVALAIHTLANRADHSSDALDAATDVLYNAIDPHDEDGLWDWLREGDYEVTDTLKSITDEWRDLVTLAMASEAE